MEKKKADEKFHEGEKSRVKQWLEVTYFPMQEYWDFGFLGGLLSTLCVPCTDFWRYNASDKKVAFQVLSRKFDTQRLSNNIFLHVLSK